ncbi:hypothetical protein ACFRCG_12420 [Embleya sp. NPDC056575]|uniref:hypothetical protein n=1 Tax=unclassified Embleya TaxID=2699296 RepID=UPI0036990240
MAGSTNSAGSTGQANSLAERQRTAAAPPAIEGLRRLARTHGGWLVGLCGALLCAVGWYGVSGERYEARQLPYLASATIPGAALIVAGAVLVVGTRRETARAPAGTSVENAELRRMMGRLYELLVEPEPSEAAAGAGAGAAWVTVPGGARYHRSGCSLVRGKSGVTPVDAAAARDRDLRPCRVCDPGVADERPGPRETGERSGGVFGGDVGTDGPSAPGADG